MIKKEVKKKSVTGFESGFCMLGIIYKCVEGFEPSNDGFADHSVKPLHHTHDFYFVLGLLQFVRCVTLLRLLGVLFNLSPSIWSITKPSEVSNSLT